MEPLFTRVVDEMVLLADGDRELAEGIRWMDARAREQSVSFYDVVLEVLRVGPSARG